MNLQIPTRDEIHRAFLKGEEAITDDLVEIKTAVDADQVVSQTALAAAVITGFEHRYQATLNEGYQHYPPPRSSPPLLNLLDQLQDFQIHDALVNPPVVGRSCLPCAASLPDRDFLHVSKPRP